MKSPVLPEVSIILPVYNAGNTISKCIESLQHQTFKNFEILLINDGSVDNTYDILKKIETSDNRIKVFDKPNGGASSARNFGMKYAKGEFLMFVDADDYIDVNFIEKLMATNAAIAIGNIRFHKGENETDFYSLGGRYEGRKSITQVLNNYFDSTLLSSCCAKTLRSDLIKKYNLRFDENLDSGEDQIFMLQYFMLCEIKSVNLITDSSYHYMMDESNSLSKRNVPLSTSVKAIEYLNSLLPPNMNVLKKKLIRSHVYNIRKSVLSAFRKLALRDICFLLRPKVSIAIIKGIKSCI